jgi:hypothetical protein
VYELNLLTLFCLAAWAVYAGMDLASRQRRSISVVVLVFCLFYGLPLALDMFIGQPEYLAFPGFRQPAWSTRVSIAYDIFVMACPIFWWLTAPRRRILGSTPPDLSGLSRIQWLLWALLISPVIALAFAPDPAFYAHYGAVVGPLYTPRIEQYHAVIAATCLVSAVAGFGLLISQPRMGPTFCRILPFVILTAWLTGKRSDLFLPVVLVWIAFWVRGYLSPGRLLSWGLATGLGFLIYSNWYQAALRPASVASPQVAYETARIDYGRDHDLRLALYCELTNTRQILSYRGESLVFDLTMAVPRSVWPEKPLPYSTYMAAAALYTKPRFFGWSVTTSILDEAIANFSWYGLLAGPLVLAAICWTGDRSDPLGKSLSVLVACLLLTMELTAFATLLLAWVLYLAWSRWATRPRPGLRQFRYAPAPRAVQGL